MSNPICRAEVVPELLADALSLPDGVNVDSVSIASNGNLILNMTGCDESLNGKDVTVIHTKTQDRTGRFIITSEIK